MPVFKRAKGDADVAPPARPGPALPNQLALRPPAVPSSPARILADSFSKVPAESQEAQVSP